jgi:hypothetical protein
VSFQLAVGILEASNHDKQKPPVAWGIKEEPERISPTRLHRLLSRGCTSSTRGGPQHAMGRRAEIKNARNSTSTKAMFSPRCLTTREQPCLLACLSTAVSMEVCQTGSAQFFIFISNCSKEHLTRFVISGKEPTGIDHRATPAHHLCTWSHEPVNSPRHISQKASAVCLSKQRRVCIRSFLVQDLQIPESDREKSLGWLDGV